MSKTDSDLGLFSISFGKDMEQKETFVGEVDDNFDAFNDETFGAIDSTDWESEHEKLILGSNSGLNSSHTSTEPIDNNNFYKKQSINESRAEDDINFGFDDIVVKSLSNLGLEDDEQDFDDPAIMTFGRMAKPLNMNALADSCRRLSRSSPPPPAILSYEEYSASPKTSTIWSATQMDSNLTPTLTTSSVNMRTLEDIETDLMNRNSDQLFQMSTIKRPIKMEELEANLLNESGNRPMDNLSGNHHMDTGWAQFGPNSVHDFRTTNNGTNLEILSNVSNIDKSLRPDTSRHDNHRDVLLQMAAQQVVSSAAQEAKQESIDPLLKAQTLSEIERQLISNQSPQQKAKPLQNMTQPLTPMPVRPNMGPTPNQIMAQNPNHPNPNQPFGPQFNQFRHHMLAQNRMNNMYNRPPVMHLVPGMHPAIGRTLFSPALIPNSQRIFPYPLQSRPIMHPLLHPLHIQQQQHLNQQQQRYSNQNQHNYRHQNRYYDDQSDRNNDDEYSGLMTQRDKEWLIRIQQMQTELKDPYVDDYYYVTYISRKIAAKAATDKVNKTMPSLLLPERPKPVIEPESSKYIPVQFEGSLGKIQVSNVNCPRKLLDCKLYKTSANSTDTTSDTKVVNKSEVQKFRKLLLEIEKLYVVLINIDDEDKRIGALPEEARKPHLQTRSQLCDKLFKGLTNESKDKINAEVAQIKKGLALLFRSLSYLSDESHRSVIISDLLNANNYKLYVIKPKHRLDYGLMLVNAIYNITNHEILLKIVANINNISIITKSEYGQALVESLLNQFEKLEIESEDKSKWSIFVNYVLDEVDDLPELRQLCRNHLTKLGF